MKPVKELLRRVDYLLHREKFDRELEEEMRHHLAMSAEDRGSVWDARQRFGNVTWLKEESRSVWIWSFWEEFVQDVRFGLRTMAKNRLFTTMAVVSLALGIGASTAIFSFMDAILLRTLPVRNPQELVVLRWNAKEMPAVIHGMAGSRWHYKATGFISPNFPYPGYQHLNANSKVLSTLFAYAVAFRINALAQNQAEFVDGGLVSGGFFSGLGVRAALGRLIMDEDDRAGAAPATVLSYEYWQRRFGADPKVIGQSVLINGTPFTVVGVAPPEFYGVDPGLELKLYLPLHIAPLLSSNAAQDEQRRFFDRNFYWVEMMGRLRPGVSIEQAQAVLAAQFRQYAESTATTAKERALFPALRLESGAGGLDSLRRRYSRPLWVLMGMVGVILAITCANIASLLLARAKARAHEMAIRLSVGASRSRVIRQLLTESVLLSLGGGLLGLLVAVWGIWSITRLLANGRDGFTLHAGVNWQVLAFTFGMALLTGVLFGLAPAMQSTRADLTGALKEARTSTGRGRYRRFGFGRLLMAGQIGLSLLLVVGAGLFVRTLSNIYSVQLGFNAENILLFSVNARQAGFKDAGLVSFYEEVLRRCRRIPGVRSAAASQMPLVSGYWTSWNLRIPGAPTSVSDPKPDTAIVKVDPDFLATMQIPILLGRGIEDRDMARARVAVVSEAFAKKFFPNQNPIGRRIGLNESNSPADIEIVGVARAALYNSVKEKEASPVAYVPYTQDLDGLNNMFILLRTAGDPLALAPAVRKTVHDLSASVPIGEVTTQRAQINQTIAEERTFASLCSAFAALALVLACVGLYGTMAYTVARRTSEIGIRVALGAERRGIIWMVLREVFTVAFAGVVIGTSAAWASTRLVESYLFGVKQHDPWVLAAAVLVLATATAVAGGAPAWRASRIDPLVALRHE